MQQAAASEGLRSAVTGPRLALCGVGLLALGHLTWMPWPQVFGVMAPLRGYVLGLAAVLILLTALSRGPMLLGATAAPMAVVCGLYALHTGLVGVHLWRIHRLHAAAGAVCTGAAGSDLSGEELERRSFEQAGLSKEQRVLPFLDSVFPVLEMGCHDGGAEVWVYDFDPYLALDGAGQLHNF